jgi:hypothetical protein
MFDLELDVMNYLESQRFAGPKLGDFLKISGVRCFGL